MGTNHVLIKRARSDSLTRNNSNTEHPPPLAQGAWWRPGGGVGTGGLQTHTHTHTSEGEGDEANHLVQGNASVHNSAGGVQRHGIIHVLVHQPEGNGLVTNQCLSPPPHTVSTDKGKVPWCSDTTHCQYRQRQGAMMPRHS